MSTYLTAFTRIVAPAAPCGDATLVAAAVSPLSFSTPI